MSLKTLVSALPRGNQLFNFDQNRQLFVDFLKSHFLPGQTRPRKDHQLKTFVVRNCSSLLDFALTESDMDLGSQCFFLLSKRVSKKIVNALLGADLFFLKATEVLAKRDVSSLIISRLSTLLSVIVKKQTSSYVETIGFLFQMLPFIEDSSVFGLFNLICSPCDDKVELQKTLAKANFSALVLKEFEGKLISNEKLANLCAVVNGCLKNPILQSGFINDKLIGIFTGLLDNSDLFLQNQLWGAISNLCVETTWKKMNVFRSFALEMFRTVFNNLHMYHVCAIDFLGTFLYYGPNAFVEASKLASFNIFFRLMAQFPNSTNLIGSIFRFLRMGLRSTDFLTDILTIVVPVLIGQCESGERTAVVANSLSFLVDIEVSRTTNRGVSALLAVSRDYCEFKDKKLKKYIEDLKIPYGGTPTRYVKEQRFADQKRKLKIREVEDTV